MLRLCFKCGYCMRHCNCAMDEQRPYPADVDETCIECEQES